MTKICFFEKEFVIFELMRYIDVTKLLNSTKLLKNVKKKFIYRKLNKKYSLKYHHNEDFRMIIHDSIENSNKQIGFTFIHKLKIGCTNFNIIIFIIKFIYSQPFTSKVII